MRNSSHHFHSLQLTSAHSRPLQQDLPGWRSQSKGTFLFGPQGDIIKKFQQLLEKLLLEKLLEKFENGSPVKKSQRALRTKTDGIAQIPNVFDPPHISFGAVLGGEKTMDRAIGIVVVANDVTGSVDSPSVSEYRAREVEKDKIILGLQKPMDRPAGI